ncbi:MAG TPA: zf-HC2 domain-containing protein [Anaerolineales bacterium]|jgi:anti-sigma factor (TIGR02949 family)
MKHEHNLECKDLLGNLSELIDGELDDETCQELRRHMDGCENCRVVFDTTTRTIYLYQTCANETRLPDDVRERLFDTLHLDDLLKPRD